MKEVISCRNKGYNGREGSQYGEDDYLGIKYLCMAGIV